MFKTIARLGKLLAENFLLVVPLILACFPIAAYLEYGPGRDFTLAAAITTPQPGDTRQVWIDVHNPRTVVF